MSLTGHLLYIDITQICGIGCTFCMYADQHRRGSSLTLSEQALQNIANLVNAPSVKRVSISGEGEPLNNIDAFHQILGLSSGGKSFEFITSGFFPHDKLAAFYDSTNGILTTNGDTCNIRLSADSYHIEKIRHRPHGFSLRYWLEQRPQSLSFSFRSIDTDRQFTRDYLVAELAERLTASRIECISPLEDSLHVDDHAFHISYKNLVHPAESAPRESLNLRDYILAIEAKYGKRFTLGSMNNHPMNNGMDITIKPDGSVYFYGIETIELGNIHSDHFTWETFAHHVAETPMISRLYTVPLLELLDKLDGQEEAQKIIDKANNPYWLIKEMSKHGAMLERMVTA